jgi:hypothetical protein
VGAEQEHGLGSEIQQRIDGTPLVLGRLTVPTTIS